MEETLDQGVGALVRDAERCQEEERVPLLRRAAAVSSFHQRDAFLAICLAFRPRDELLEIIGSEPEFQDAVPERVESCIALGVPQVREAREDPVEPLPLVVDLPSGPGLSEFSAAGKERPNPRGTADLLLELTDPFGIAFLAEDPHARLPAARRLLRFQTGVPDRRWLLPILRSQY